MRNIDNINYLDFIPIYLNSIIAITQIREQSRDFGYKELARIKEVEALGIHVGCVVTYEDEFMILNKKYYVGRALDNRMGGFMIAEVARLLHENKVKLPFGLYITNAVPT